jgi:tryptophan synthase alpha chain
MNSANINSRAAIMAHIVFGYPSVKESIQLIDVLANAGVSLIEIQIPFSDPIGDGPTIMTANDVALQNGVTPQAVLDTLSEISHPVPLYIMTYLNILFRYKGGIKKFLSEAKKSEITGLIVPDAPIEEPSYWSEAKRLGLIPVPLVAPTSGEERLKQIKAKTAVAGGFTYCISTLGTTGARSGLHPQLVPYLKTVRRIMKSPLAVGFGISTPEQITLISPYAEIAVVGSATIDILNNSRPRERLKNVERFVKKLVTG